MASESTRSPSSPSPEVQKFSIMDGFQEAMRDLPTGDYKEVAQKFMSRIEKELEADPVAMIHQAAVIGAGLNSLTPERLGHGLGYLAKLVAWKAISAAEPAFTGGERKEVSSESKTSEQEARHAS